MITFLELGKLGRFGNSMFQLASTIGLATKHGYSFAFPYWENHDHKTRFGSNEDCDLQKYFVHPLPLIPEDYKPMQIVIQWGYHTNPIPDWVSLWGHMQSEKYFKHCAPLIRYYFEMKDPYPQNDWIAIHVRLGDYDDQYHPRMTLDYFKRAMALFPTGSKFLVFSDDVASASEMFKGVADVWIRPNADYIDDFKFMQSCRHFITANSTYSWWAAWLGKAEDKKVIAPINWFGPSWPNYREMSKDIYPIDWIVI